MLLHLGHLRSNLEDMMYMRHRVHPNSTIVTVEGSSIVELDIANDRSCDIDSDFELLKL